MSSRSNIREAPALALRGRSWRAFRGRVETHILLNFLQTGARRADGREWRLHRYCITARDRPGIYVDLSMAASAHALTPRPQLTHAVADWGNSVRELTQRRAIRWCEGTDAE